MFAYYTCREVGAEKWTAEQLHGELRKITRQKFHLDQPPVMRAYVFRRSIWGTLLVLVTHHISVDLWSLVLLLEDLATMYQVC